jgi:hypothetical protein
LIVVTAVAVITTVALAILPAWASFSRLATSAGSVGTATLAPPSGLTAAGGVRLSWTATPSTWATGTRVLRATTPGGPYTQIAQIVGRATTTSTDNPGLGTFYYVVQAYYSGNGANWNSVNSNEVRGGIALIQKAAGGGVAATISATFAAGPTAGDLLIAVVATRTSGTITGPSGWSTAINQTGAPSQAIFYKVAGAAEPTGVSATTTATGNGNGIHVYEYRGVTTLDASSSATGTGTAVASGSLTTTTANILVIARTVKLAGSSYTAWTNGFIQQNSFTKGTTVTLFAGADVVSGAVASYTTTGTSATSGAWRGQIVAFR